MVENAPYLSHQHAGLTIEGYSRAAVQSYWRVAELRLGFDMGAQPWDFMNTPTWFLSHLHLDHMAALPVFVARRRMMKMEPPVIYLPAYGVEDVERILKLFQRLDRGRQVCTLNGVQAGDEIELSRDHVVTVLEMAHTVPALGFVVWERRRKLKEEYLGLPGERIRDLKLSGVDITHEVRIPLVAYTGDTNPAGLDANPVLFQAKILITEMSFVRAAHRREHVHKFGHLHLDDFVERADRFQNEVILCGHLSTRYHPAEAKRIVEANLPDPLRGKIRLWL